jgi:hypothetical protein
MEEAAELFNKDIQPYEDETHLTPMELHEAGLRLEEWRNDPKNWNEVADYHETLANEEKDRRNASKSYAEGFLAYAKMAEDSEPEKDYEQEPAQKKRKREEKGESEKAPEAPSDLAKVAFFIDRVDDFRLFLKRRLPPDNPTAQKVLAEFYAMSCSEFAHKILEQLPTGIMSLAVLNLMGGLELVWGKLLTECAMKAEDFVDRSLERPDLDTPERKKDQLALERQDFHTQVKDLVELAKNLPKTFTQ